MPLGYHLMFSAYGFWLPNDPRGSGSRGLYADKLWEFGGPTKVAADDDRARHPHDRRKRLAAKTVLDRPPVKFDGVQAAVARGFTNSVRRSRITIWACAVMPDHVHLVVAPHRHPIETLGNLPKGDATHQLMDEGIHPFQGRKGFRGRPPSCFGRKWWVIFKDTDEALAAIRYVVNNPIKAGLKAQDAWTCVTKYPGLYRPPKDGGAK